MTDQEWWNNLVKTRELEYPGLIKVKRTLSDRLYPDKAHFIYELLQNAEDVQANNVSFILEEDKLIVKHNGRNFSQKDVTAITDVDESTKSSDNEKIGKFGLGFKSVFNYTNKPKIYSGNFAFEINWIIPEKIVPIALSENETVLIFPFDKEDKPPLVAFEEILKGIQDIDDNTLLFLNHINTISCEFNNQSFTITRSLKSENEIEISNTLKNTNSRWLRFKKYLPDMPKLYVAIAYSIQENEKTKKDEIIPIDGKVSIFFPAEKETSKLKFHIHAPFISPVARDSLENDNKKNVELIDLIADTLIESFDYIKSRELLTISFLEVLPNKKDDLSTYYPSILTKCIEIFQKQPYMLTESGEYQPSSVCYQGSASLKKLINDDDLRILSGHSNVYWSKNAFQNRSDDYIQSLRIDVFNDEMFYKKLYDIAYNYGNDESFREENRDDYEQFNTLFSCKSDEWYLKFYVFLKEYEESNWIDEDRLKFFIRLQNGQLNIDCRDCYFDSGLQSGDFLYVKRETYTSSKKASDNEKAEAFLEFLGVKEVDEKDKIISLLDIYKKGTFPTFSEHIKHLKEFIKYYEASNDKYIFMQKTCLVSTSQDDKQNYWMTANNIYLDKPFEDTGLNLIAKGSLDLRYLDHFKNVELKGFINFCKAIGVVYKLKINQANINNNPERYGKLRGVGKNVGTAIQKDWIIDDLQILLRAQKNEIALLVWQCMLSAHPETFKAINQMNKSNPIKEADSQLIYHLKSSVWIPDKNGNFHKPSDISANELPEDFVVDNRNGWLSAIGFGENKRKSEEEYVKKAKVAKEITGGHDLEDLEALKDIPPDQLKAFIIQMKNKISAPSKISQPIDVVDAISKHSKSVQKNKEEIDPAIVTNNTLYLDQLRKQHNHTIQKSAVAKSRNYTAKIKEGKEATELFLYDEYKGHCQICGFTFTKTDGKNHFELLDWGAEKITKIKTNLILPASSLCVCPNCHSMVKYGSFSSEFIDDLGKVDLSKFSFDIFCEKINSITDQVEIPDSYKDIEFDMYKLPIKLNGLDKYIFYTEEHFLHFFDLACLARKGVS